MTIKTTRSIITVYYKNGEVVEKRDHIADAEGVWNDLADLRLWEADRKVSAATLIVQDKDLLSSNAQWMTTKVDSGWRILLGNPNTVDGKSPSIEYPLHNKPSNFSQETFPVRMRKCNKRNKGGSK